MRVGYLHLALPGYDQAGLTRYGRRLAAEARRRPELEVLEAEATLDHDVAANAARLRAAARQLAQADVVHLQYSRYLWRAGWQQRYYWRVVQRACGRPLVATLHDIYPYFYPPAGAPAVLRGARAPGAPLVRQAKSVLGALKNYWLDGLTVRAVMRACRAVLVCTAEEQRRAAHLAPPGRLRVIPHFVEARRLTVSHAAARQQLGFGAEIVVTLQGFLYPNKGHRLLVRALAELPPHVRVHFAGGPAAGQGSYVREVQALADASGVASRLNMTGYLTDDEMELHLAASDLAVCPFSIVSASSSLASWISVARPILASDLPQMVEYGRWAPGAVRIFRPYTPAALAAAIQAVLPECGADDDPAVGRLRAALAMPVVFNTHLDCYRQAAGTITAPS